MANSYQITTKLIEQIKKDALIEFESLSKIYRPSFKTRKICDYLKERIGKLQKGAEVYEDAYRSFLVSDYADAKVSSGNIWYDLPANDKTMVDNEPIIMQSHMDMVCVYRDEKVHEDMKKNGVKFQYHSNGTLTSKNCLTSLGADNGIGIAIMLAIIKNREFKHGPIRFIFTADEEVGLSGASYFGLTKQGEKGYPVKEFKYLINNDGASCGEILLSTAGRVISSYTIPSDPTTKPISSNQKVYTLDVSGLLGGHSGDQIAKHYSAINLVAQVLDEINKNKELRIIEFLSPDSDQQNIIHPHAVATFATKLSLAQIEKIVQSKVKAIKAKYPDEKKIITSIVEKKILQNVEIKPYSNKVCSQILKLLSSVKTGVISWKNKAINWVETSGNIGPIWLKIKKTQINDKIVWECPSFEVLIGYRSCNNKAIESLISDAKKYAKTCLGNDDLDYYRLKTLFYGWPGNEDDILVETAKGMFKKMGVKCKTRNLHGGLEVSWLKYFNPELNILSIGAEIHGMHSKYETLYLDSLNAVIGVTLGCIAKMKDIKNKRL